MLRIGDVATKAGVSTRALRYYEEQGLLPAERTTSGQRIYPESAIERVQLIQRLYTAGLPRDRIAAGIAELERAREELSRVIDICLNPTPEHCPALRESGPAYEGAHATAATA